MYLYIHACVNLSVKYYRKVKKYGKTYWIVKWVNEEAVFRKGGEKFEHKGKEKIDCTEKGGMYI